MPFLFLRSRPLNKGKNLDGQQPGARPSSGVASLNCASRACPHPSLLRPRTGALPLVFQDLSLPDRAKFIMMESGARYAINYDDLTFIPMKG
jgi:hypothetical protein